jgi:prepilin-type N-terminal cleavage/methylation domain-containing protein
MTTPHWIQRVCHRMGYDTTGADDAGFTLLEVIVSFVIFAIVAASAATAIYRAVHASHLSQQRANASGVAQSVIADAIAKANLNQTVPEAGKVILSTVGCINADPQHPQCPASSAAGEQFTVVRTITFDAGTTCAPGKLFTVSVVVNQAQTGQFLARSDSRVACPPA